MLSIEFYEEVEKGKKYHTHEIYLLKKRNDEEAQKIKNYHYRAITLLSKYGLKIEDYDKCLEAQGGGCKVCGINHIGRSLFPRFLIGTKELREIVCYRCLRKITSEITV